MCIQDVWKRSISRALYFLSCNFLKRHFLFLCLLLYLFLSYFYRLHCQIFICACIFSDRSTRFAHQKMTRFSTRVTIKHTTRVTRSCINLREYIRTSLNFTYRCRLVSSIVALFRKYDPRPAPFPFPLHVLLVDMRIYACRVYTRSLLPYICM